jgi:pimeloyl-ACP methyl ester carboxylesterase
MATTATRSGYAPVNGLEMYYEIHGEGRPLVLIHGGLSEIQTSFGKLLPGLARTRQAIGVELQAHGHTADIDRPLSFEQMADDVAALVRHIGIEQTDVFGYSIGGGVGLQMAIRHPELVRKLVALSVSYRADGLHPGMLEGIEQLKPENLAGTPFEAAYAKTAPRPQDWPKLIERVKELDRNVQDWPAESIQSIKAPVLLIAADSDIIRPEHAVEMFRLLGGGVAGDIVGLPRSQLAILPGTTHITTVERAELLLPMITTFLDTPER